MACGFSVGPAVTCPDVTKRCSTVPSSRGEGRRSSHSQGRHSPHFERVAPADAPEEFACDLLRVSVSGRDQHRPDAGVSSEEVRHRDP